MSFRVKGEKRQRKDYKDSLPVYSVNTVREAMELITKVGILGWVGGGPAWLFYTDRGDYRSLDACSQALHKAYQEKAIT